LEGSNKLRHHANGTSISIGTAISGIGVSRAPAAGGGLPMLQLRHYIT